MDVNIKNREDIMSKYLLRKLADKRCYPTNQEYGLTFRERLIISLASNPALIKRTANGETFYFKETSKAILDQADSLINETEKSAGNEHEQ